MVQLIYINVCSVQSIYSSPSYSQTMQKKTLYHDPVHKTILAGELEHLLINSDPVQRLRGIQQLGLADVIFPGATHTRFEHSLGTMHTASILGSSLGLEQEDIEKLRLAGLLHDVGHSAFSHAVEGILKREPAMQPHLDGKRFLKHEAFTRYIIESVIPEDRAIAGYVEEYYGQDCSKFFRQISCIATGDHSSIDRPYLAQLIAGDIDADRIDFLLRDSYHTGVGLGLIDVDQIVENLYIKDGNVILGDPEGDLDGEMTLVAAESMLIARSHHYTAIIHHPGTQAVRTMLLNALENALEHLREKKGDEFVREVMVDFFTVFNDMDLLNFIHASGDGYARRLLQDIRSGRLYRPVSRFNQKTLSPATRMALSTIARHGVARKMFEKELEKSLCEITGHMPGDILADLSVASGVPRATRVVIGGQESFFYDESTLASGLVRAISRQMYLTAFMAPDHIGGGFSLKDGFPIDVAIQEVVDELSPRLLGFIREEQYLSVEGLILLFYAIHSLFQVVSEEFVSIPRIRNITWFYRTIEKFGNDERLQYLFDYDFHSRYGFPYSEKVFEDMQLLVAMGIVDEDLRYFEKAGHFKQRYEYVLTGDGSSYGKSLLKPYEQEFKRISSYLELNKHTIPRDMVTISRSRYGSGKKDKGRKDIYRKKHSP